MQKNKDNQNRLCVRIYATRGHCNDIIKISKG